jgi:hypothetical protein
MMMGWSGERKFIGTVQETLGVCANEMVLPRLVLDEQKCSVYGTEFSSGVKSMKVV